ncbi:MAG TPA: DUF2905 domain-containing protein [Leptolyngbyaceae cyanobacterium M33_DOE_097]|uniref:DUF2905 domain-containing protein n=1 Tax=Oscillatoriales cyanobacterium SpSt-418 TaxID=2282169 RepID=A0A7C3KF08_9CYAN|nr:DUF2905 domain-containing protein [Leptolyngbyaceae cyanobacterium M33_DOE_097]
MESIGKFILAIGGLLVLIGAVLWAFGDQLGWLGNLPGDIKVERPGFSFYMPITTMLLISLSLSLVLWVVSKVAR